MDKNSDSTGFGGLPARRLAPNHIPRGRRHVWNTAVTAVLAAACGPVAAQQLTGETGAHDPSTLHTEGGTYYYFATGAGIRTRSSDDMTSWSAGPTVFATPPAWTTQAVPGFTGTFWAPDVVRRNNQYYLYYSVSTWGSQVSAIGLTTSPTLDPAAPGYGWTDQGPVIQSQQGSAYNTIDPAIFQDTDGRVWMAFGSYWDGIFVTELNPSTGKLLSPGAAPTRVADNSRIEAAALLRRGNYYYLFVNHGTCCAGIDSTYEIRVGRGTSPTGPFLDRNGNNLLNGGGTLFLDDDGRRTGPGHFSHFAEAGQEYFSYHYYDGDRNGARTYGLRKLHWTADNWPSYAAVNPQWTGSASANWSAAANWSDGAPGGVGHVANFASVSSNRYAVALDGGGRTVGTVNLGGGASYTIGATGGHTLTLDAADGADAATLNVSAGNHTVAAPVSAIDPLGVNVTPSGSTLTLAAAVSGPKLVKYGHGTLALGGPNAYTDNVHVKAGTLHVTGSVTAGRFSSIGQGVGDNGTMVVRGTGSFTAGGDLNVGDTGDKTTPATGTLDLRDDASVTVGPTQGFYVGSGFSSGTRAVGTVDQSGGTLTVTGAADGLFVIGGRTSKLAVGTYNLAGGVVRAGTNVRVGGYGTGTVNQTGGVFDATAGVSIGRFSGATGAWTVASGTLDHDSPASMLIVGDAGTGTLTVSGAGAVVTNGSLRLGNASAGVGTVNLDGGTVATPLVARGAGSATLNFNGGTLRAAAGSATFLQGLTNAHVSAGGARVDTQAFDVTVAQPLRHAPSLGSAPDGGLTKSGAGTLTLAGDNTYTGPTTLAGGTLVLRPPAAAVVTGGGGATIAAPAGRLVFDYAGGTSSASTVVPLLRASAAADFQSGQFRLAAAAGGPHRTLGYRDDPAAAALTILPAWYGDLDLDGTVDADDYLLIDRGLALSLTGWANGDVDYSGAVSPADYLLMDAAYINQGIPLSPEFLADREARFGTEYVAGLLAAVPEPTGLTLLIAAPALRPVRRRRRT